MQVFLFPNLMRQINDREKKAKKHLLKRLSYSQLQIEKGGFTDQELLQAMHIAPDVARTGNSRRFRDIIYCEGDNIVFCLALLICSVPQSFITHLQIMKALPPPQPIIAQSLTDLLQTMITQSKTMRDHPHADPRQHFIEWLNRVFAREVLQSIVEKIRQLVESCWTSEHSKRLQELSAKANQPGSDDLGTDYLQVSQPHASCHVV